MDPTERFSERGDRDWKEHWWFPAALGAIAFAALFLTVTDGVKPSAAQMALALFGIQVGFLDGLGTWRVMDYGTIQGPPEREMEANARFYAWERASRRYITATVLSIVSALLLPRFHSEETQLATVLVPLGVYFTLWGIDVFRSLREAKFLFPPGTD